MSKRVIVSVPKMPAPKPQVIKIQPVKAPSNTPVKTTPNIVKNQGIVGGKSLIPKNLQQFTTNQLRGNAEKGRSIRELREISKNRANPPVDRIIKPPFVMPKEGNT